MKHVVITGASRGLGRAMAIGFASDGWTVSGCGTDVAALRLLAGELGPDHHLQPCDVTDPAAVEKFAMAVTERFGAPELLLNNAATINPNKPLWEVTAGEFGRVIDINLKGVHLIIRAFLPGMIQRGKGVVVNFSSGWGRLSSDNYKSPQRQLKLPTPGACKRALKRSPPAPLGDGRGEVPLGI